MLDEDHGLWIDYDICEPSQCNYECISSCPVNKRHQEKKAVFRKDNKPKILYDVCNECKRCVVSCPLGAIKSHDTSLQSPPNYSSKGLTQLQNWTDQPFIIDELRYSRFSEHNTIFARVLNDPDFMAYQQSIDKNHEQIFEQRKQGYREFDAAVASAAWTLYDRFDQAFSWEDTEISAEMKFDADIIADTDRKVIFEDTFESTRIIKQAAKAFGAALVGITTVNDQWLYTHDRQGNEIHIPDDLKNVIVMLVEMDLELLQTSPAYPASFATGNGYSKMAFIQACMASFVRQLGYQAIPAGNNIGLSVPLAIEAGLGQFGRHGLLITEAFGSNVRICKVYTDLPLKHDKPINFGVLEFCRTCKRCAEQCPSQSISYDYDPSWEGKSKSNNPGILKWYVDVESCYDFWVKNGNDCSNCIVSCPFTKNRAWWHNIPRYFIKHFPMFNRFWVTLDRFMGYGKQRDPGIMWNKKKDFIHTRK